MYVSEVKGLYGAQFEKKRACGRCHYHNLYLTPQMVKAKKCLSKQCDALEKYDHEWWHQRELTKQRKKTKKQELKKKYGI